MKKRIINIMTVFTLVLSLLSSQVINATSEPEDTGLTMLKEAKFNPETNQVDYILEAYQTGEVKTEEKVKPLDVILVLDQSGSMSENLSDGLTRLEALQGAVRRLVDNLHSSSSEHRVALVGFASSENIHNNQSYENTNLLSGNDSKLYNQLDESDYANAFIPISNQSAVKRSIESLKADGATATYLGMDMARKIIEHDEGSNQKVVIVFTDGSPNTNPFKNKGYKPPKEYLDNSWQYPLYRYERDTGAYFQFSSANESIRQAQIIKDKGVPVYTVGMLNNADPHLTDRDGNIISEGDPINEFLHFLSSNFHEKNPVYLEKKEKCYSNNYPSHIEWCTIINNTKRKKPEDKNYYMSAQTSEELKSIFEKISEDIVSAPSVELTEETVLKDIVADSFVLPEGFTPDDVIVSKHAFKGFKQGEEIWEEVDAEGVSVVVDSSTQSVSVKGFNYSSEDNLVLKEQGKEKGHKLRVEFSADVRDGFLGGKDVPTNRKESGLYVEGEELVESFPVPTIDVPLNVPMDKLHTEDMTVYALTQFDLMDLLLDDKGNLFGNESLQLDGINNAFVDTQISIYDKSDSQVPVFEKKIPKGSQLENLNQVLQELIEDHQYEIKMSFSIEGDKSKTLEGTSNVYVLKPFVEVEDSQSYLGEKTRLSKNIQNKTWTHEKIDEIPTVSTKYEKPNIEMKVESNQKIKNLDEEYAFENDRTFQLVLKQGDEDVTEKLLGKKEIEFEHKVIPLQITIEKGIEGVNLGNEDHFIFNITWHKPEDLNHFDDYSAPIVVQSGKDKSVTITNLPIGEYSIEEDLDWSWKYELDSVEVNEQKVGLSDDNKVTFKVEAQAEDTNTHVKVNNRKKRVKNLHDEKKIRNVFDGKSDQE